jgi:hypothetical protein
MRRGNVLPCVSLAGLTDLEDGSSGRMPEACSNEVERAESEFGAPIRISDLGFLSVSTLGFWFSKSVSIRV